MSETFQNGNKVKQHELYLNDNTCAYLCLPGCSPTAGWSGGQCVPGWVCPDFTWRDRDGAGTEHQDVSGITLLVGQLIMTSCTM